MSLDIPDSVIGAILRTANYGATTGRMNTPLEQDYVALCSHFHWQTGTTVLYTRDTGHHTGGWFKNPDFERCKHLSIAFRDPWPHRPADELATIGRVAMLAQQMGVVFNSRPFDPAMAEAWVKAILRDDRKLAWTESPFTRAGKAIGVRHYRVFCDRAWAPIKPRGEVYNRELTERGWNSYSDIGALMPSHVNAD